ncbi:MAG: hypothetical protein JW700_02260 [Candidatus Aenigmarchaeota archaeon]|nr:hypothetical protein [Candidatus Aenigmarchaeota archaeon]
MKMSEKLYEIPIKFILVLIFVGIIMLILFSTKLTSGLLGDKTIPTVILGAIMTILGK